MPVVPKVVLAIKPDGTVAACANNLGNDLQIKVVRSLQEFTTEALGIPYSATIEQPAITQNNW